MSRETELRNFATRVATEFNTLRDELAQHTHPVASDSSPGYLQGIILAEGETVPTGLPLPSIIVRVPA